MGLRIDQFANEEGKPMSEIKPSDEVVLFVAYDDGTVNCAWCERNFDADLAVPDDADDPICPECAKDGNE
jgi:hypothetical protein